MTFGKVCDRGAYLVFVVASTSAALRAALNTDTRLNGYTAYFVSADSSIDPHQIEII